MQTNHLIQAILEAVNALTSRAKPSPYAKRLPVVDSTPREAPAGLYVLETGARARRRGEEALPLLEQQACAAAKEYYDAIRKQ